MTTCEYIDVEKSRFRKFVPIENIATIDIERIAYYNNIIYEFVLSACR